VFNWTATLYKGSIRLTTPMLYCLGFIGLFTIGGLTGLHLASIASDIHLQDTYFVVAHFHYIMVGGAIMAYLGAMHFWWPKATGLEWQMPSPPTTFNFDVTPVVTRGPYAYNPEADELEAAEEDARRARVEYEITRAEIEAGHRQEHVEEEVGRGV